MLNYEEAITQSQRSMSLAKEAMGQAGKASSFDEREQHLALAEQWLVLAHELKKFQSGTEPPEKDAQVREGIATADGLVGAKMTPPRELRLANAAESRAVADEELDGAALRERADALGELAQETQGKKRNELLDEADKWDALAEARDKAEGLDRPELPAKDETAASTIPVGDTETSRA